MMLSTPARTMGIVPWPPLNPSPVRLTRLLPTTNSSTPPPSFRPFHSSHARPAALSPKPTIPVLDYRVPTAAFPSRLPQRISYCHDPEQADNELSRLNDEVVRLVEAGEEVPDHTLSLSLRAVDKLGGRFGSELSLAVITIVTVDDVLILHLARMQALKLRPPTLLKPFLENPFTNKRIFGATSALRLFARESDLWDMRPRRLLDIVGLCEFVRPSIVPQLELGDASLSSVFEILTGDVLGARVPEELTRQYNYDTVGWNEKHRVRNYVVNSAWGAHLVADTLLDEMDKTAGWWGSRYIKHMVTYQ